MSIFHVRVRRGPFSGKASDETRLNILPGLYQVREDGAGLVFEGADTRTGGSLIVDMREYPEIGEFPDAIQPHTQIELAE